jgi:hypothetical protein
MKTAAAVVLIVALISLVPKKKKQPLPPSASSTSTRVVPSKNCKPPENIVIDEKLVGQIVMHGKKLFRRQSVSDEKLDIIARNIIKYSELNCIEPEIAAALIARESGYNPRAVSPSGACGLGQMLPSTARNMGASDCFDIEQNLRGAMAYLRQMLDMWDGYSDQMDRALASYLLGPLTVKKRGGVPWNNGTCKRYITDIYSYRDKIKSY